MTLKEQKRIVDQVQPIIFCEKLFRKAEFNENIRLEELKLTNTVVK